MLLFSHLSLCLLFVECRLTKKQKQHVEISLFFTLANVLQAGIFWISIFHASVLCNLSNRFVSQSESFPPLKCEQARGRDICLPFNGYGKCFCNSTPPENFPPLQHTSQHWNEVGTLCLQNVSIFTSKEDLTDCLLQTSASWRQAGHPAVNRFCVKMWVGFFFPFRLIYWTFAKNMIWN